MRTLAAVIGKVQALLGDPTGQWVTRDYVVPLIDITYGSIVLNMKNASGKELEAVVPILNVPPGTTSLYPWQSGTAVPGAPPEQAAPAALLAGLFDVIEVWIKPAGAPVWAYRQIKRRNTLPHVNPFAFTTNTLGAVYFDWLGNQLLITPVNQPIDIEVTGKFNPQPLVEDDNQLTAHEDVWIPTSFKTAAIAGVERSNPAVLGGYATESVASQDNIIAAIMREAQATPIRFQRMSRDTGLAQWFWS